MQAPYNCERQDEEDAICDDVEKGIGKIELVFVHFLRRSDVCIPICLNWNGEPDVGDCGADRIACVDTDEEPANDAKPFLDKDAAVEQDQ